MTSTHIVENEHQDPEFEDREAIQGRFDRHLEHDPIGGRDQVRIEQVQMACSDSCLLILVWQLYWADRALQFVTKENELEFTDRVDMNYPANRPETAQNFFKV